MSMLIKRWWFWRSWRWDEIKWATFVTALSTLPGSSLSKRSVAPWIICNQMQLLRITMKLWRNWLDGNSRICCWPKQQRDDEESRQRLESPDSEPRWAPSEGRPVTIIILLRVDFTLFVKIVWVSYHFSCQGVCCDRNDYSRHDEEVNHQTSTAEMFPLVLEGSHPEMTSVVKRAKGSEISVTETIR